MGTFRQSVTLFSPQRDRSETIDAMVDTGSTFTWVPTSILRELGVEADRERTFILADGSQTRREMAEVHVALNGEQVTTLVVFAPEGTQPLLGAYTLEAFSLTADVTNRRLVPAENYALSLDTIWWRDGDDLQAQRHGAQAAKRRVTVAAWSVIATLF